MSNLGPMFNNFSSEEYHEIDRKVQAGPYYGLNPNGIMSKVTPDAGEHGDFVKVYRGLQVHPKDVNYNKLGQHWTTNPLIADWAARGEAQGDAEVENGTIIEGLVHKKHAITAEHPEFKEFRAVNQISNNPGEREIPLLPGAPVTITGVYHMTNSPETKDMENAQGEENWGNAKKVKAPTNLGRV